MNERGNSNIEKTRKKLHYRANHRGMKEMDVYLGTFVRDNLDAMGEKDLATFGQLLQIADNDLWRYFVRGEEPTFVEDNDILEMLALMKASWQNREL